MSRTQIDSSLVPSASSAFANINNILINGGMEFWQRGTTFTNPGNGIYTADRWYVNTNAASNAVASQDTTIIDSGISSYKVIVSGSPSSKYWYLMQKIENYQEYSGKILTVSVKVKSSIANACRVGFADGSTTTYSSYHTGDGTWQTLTATITVSSTPSYIAIAIGMLQNGDMQNGSYYFDSAMLVSGSSAVSFVPKNYQTELAQCQRYYQTALFDTNRTIPLWYTNPNDYFYYIIEFKVPMRVNPTMTFGGGSALPTSYYTFPTPGASNSVAGPSLTFTNPGGGTVNKSAGYSSNTHQTTYSMFTINSGSWTAEAEL